MNGQTAYYFYNGHADVTSLIDGQGNNLASYYYDAFGNITEHTGTFDNNITYAGYQYDKETGKYYLNARMYDPVTARFMQEDTYRGDVNDPLSLNLYTYCSNEPIKHYDPTGHVVDVIADVGFIIWDIKDIAQDPKNWKNWGGLGLDVGGAFVPFVTGGGRALKLADKTADAYRVADKGYDAYRAVDKGYDLYRTYDRTYSGYKSSDEVRNIFSKTSKAQSGSIASKADVEKAFKLKASKINKVDNLNKTINEARMFDNSRDTYKMDLQLFGSKTRITGAVGKVEGFSGKITRVGNNVEDMGKTAKSGEFSITNWDDYPTSIQKPEGPFRLLEGTEYETARDIANQANRAIHSANPSLKGMQVHEIQPVKFGGSPTDILNKVPLTPTEHAKVTSWWRNLQRKLKK